MCVCVCKLHESMISGICWLQYVKSWLFIVAVQKTKNPWFRHMCSDGNILLQHSEYAPPTFFMFNKCVCVCVCLETGGKNIMI